MQFALRLCLLLPLIVLAFGCAGYKTTSTGATRHGANTPRARYTNDVPAARHYAKWNPAWWFGNIDSPTPPDKYRPEDKCRTTRWYWRNSLHNFTHYVIGIRDKSFVRVGKFPDKVFAPKGGWNWAVCKYKWLRLPFISYRKADFKFYCGWRERGNFGFKLNF
jgi:hypothetical protein